MAELTCGNKKPNESLDQNFWEDRWQQEETGWDLGAISPPIAEYIRQFPNKNASILIPGCGNAYEAEYFLSQGFTDITILDFAPKAAEILQEKFKNQTQIKVLCEDFFQHVGAYDLVVEQTFFCAISPLQRKNYVQKVHDLLRENGKIIGVLFNHQFEKQGPPFGGSLAEYQFLFQKKFDIITMENCYNSVDKRKNTELFINLKKKND